eukprot:CAMPEP_0194765806 /NCGR_PEP_ID=MMETSP0323_2-20130528/27234_1 /TAXON_ID=2866 ORGANISM="Crypthecodinium cohnii, Strain Seligo" /NCGR_SAMPLE_ID=MMETSP0323_2 /ASSEMBLY_ACC=CAM_ASM_000346 /LENGTH=55 /DNA_ID=CAMNT_0039695965 /DNA_START=506 /DNA_END=673 /DNA_ORIENTATION=-
MHVLREARLSKSWGSFEGQTVGKASFAALPCVSALESLALQLETLKRGRVPTSLG